MTIRLFLVGALMLANLNACTSISEIVISGRDAAIKSSWFSHGSSSRSNRLVLSPDSQFYIARNSMLTKLNSANSDALSAVLKLAISENFPQSQIGLLPESFQQALTKAGSLGAHYLLFPSIIEWEDRPGARTEHALQPSYDTNSQITPKFGLDRALVQLMIVHVVSGSVMDVIKLEASSGFLSSSSNSTESVLLPQLQTLFASLVVTF
jgi:hypothetical protein